MMYDRNKCFPIILSGLMLCFMYSCKNVQQKIDITPSSPEIDSLKRMLADPKNLLDSLYTKNLVQVVEFYKQSNQIDSAAILL